MAAVAAKVILAVLEDIEVLLLEVLMVVMGVLVI